MRVGNAKNTEAGFTLMEACMATAIIGPLMVGVMGATGAVGGALGENERSAGVTTAARSVSDRLAQLIMRADPATMKVISRSAVRVLASDVVVTPASAEFWVDPITEGLDVTKLLGSAGTLMSTSIRDLGDGSHYVTHLGSYAEYTAATATKTSDWTGIQQAKPSDSLRFASVSGTVSMNAKGRTDERTLEFVLDRNEIPNGVDDDGDGMVDEGRLMMTVGKNRTLLARDVEVCSFTLEGRVIRFAIRCCRRDDRGKVHRTTIQKRILIRNKG